MNIPSFTKVIINIVVKHYCLLNSIITDQDLLFTSKFMFLLYYFLKIKQKLFITIYFLIDGQIKRQNSTMKAHLKNFVN